MIYLDNAATTRLDPAVLEAMLPWLQEDFGNASAQYALGRKARVAVEDARSQIARCIGAEPAEVFFTSGGTEANNTVIKSLAWQSRSVRTIACTTIEHHAVLHPAEAVARAGIELVLLPVDESGVLRLDAVEWERLNRPDVLVSVMHANNETGALQPVAAVRSLVPRALLHTDAVQSFGKVPFDVRELGVDFMTISAHKIHGPKGIGALYVRRGVKLEPYMHGGGQERGRRGGTEAVALIVGFAEAARRAIAEMEGRRATMQHLRDMLIAQLQAQIPQIRINTPADALPNIVNISFLDAERLDGEAILQLLDMHGVACSNGSACTSGSMQPSHVLKAMGRPEAEARAAVRFSVSKDTTEEEILQAVEILAAIVAQMREAAQPASIFAARTV
ncbi:MAG: cysteine desulfurase family protein [Bacteroidota bacterium]|nr:cysteine desulfurase [Candidatus Kapabacteria bacterium]MCS7302730.1 cysteine desulfurase [Candidatus Kapabacteria bacterium]MCX7937053.1 cysteine desulfurase [Chlorobiota bacterium]MDW8075152.1 cysteine desulfurase family protein [Bacteroidota bacterium]MDW8272383.1 cysteine desulfurase family protein [Bacteroidota bacterium]